MCSVLEGVGGASMPLEWSVVCPKCPCAYPEVAYLGIVGNCKVSQNRPYIPFLIPKCRTLVPNMRISGHAQALRPSLFAFCRAPHCTHSPAVTPRCITTSGYKLSRKTRRQRAILGALRTSTIRACPCSNARTQSPIGGTLCHTDQSCLNGLAWPD